MMTPRNIQRKTHNGFAIPIQPDTELGLAILIAVNEEGGNQLPISVVSSINEAREIAASHFQGLRKRTEHGGDAPICPYEYKLYARGVDGDYFLVTTISA